MASEVLIGLKIGAVATASVATALGSTRRALAGLSTVTRGLEVQQRRLGRTMASELARGGSALARQHIQYERLTVALRKVKAAQTSLAAATLRSTEMTQRNRQAWANLVSTAMTAWGAIKTATATAGQAATFKDTLRDTRINANLSAEQEAALGTAIRGAVGPTNQGRDALAASSKSLLGGGSSLDEVKSEMNLMGDVMTGLRTNSDATTGAMLALRDMGATDRDSMQRGIDKLVGIGQQGQFSPEMMINAFAELGDTIKTAGLKGDQAIGELAAGLQLAEGRMGADGAKAGLQSWLEGLDNKRLSGAYESAGVDYEKSMARMQAQGLSQYQASLELAGGFLRDKLSKKDQQALLKGDNDGRIGSMLQSLGLGEVFRDMNAARFALATINNKADYKKMAGTSGAGSLDTIATLRKESPTEQMKALRLSVNELGLDIGAILLPPLLDTVAALKPVVAGIRDFTRANPGLVTTLGSVAAGVVGFKVLISGLGFGINFLIRAPFAQLRTGLNTLRAAWAMLGGQVAMGLPLLKGLGAISGGLGKSVLNLGKLLGGRLLSGLSLALKGVMLLGRAMLMNPIGLLVTGIGIAAFLINKYWEPICGFFSNLWGTVRGVFDSAWQSINETVGGAWAELKSAFDGGIAGISALILNWSPLGLFYRAFSGVMSYFGIELPSKFSEFGRMLVTGLVDGISGMASAVRDSLVGLGASAAGWFKQTLGINSPSKVFAQLGAGVPEGAAKGITGGSALVRDAALGMAAATAVAMPTSSFALDGLSLPAPAALNVPMPPARSMDAYANPAATMTVTFSPTIQITATPGNASDVREQVRQGLKLSFAEFERLMQQYNERTGRRGYGDI